MKKEALKPDLAAGATPLAIIGIGCLFPQAEDRDTYWANIREGIDAITEIPRTHWHISDYYNGDPKAPDMTYGRRGGFLSPVQFNPMEFNIPPNIIEAIDTSQLLGLVTAGQALKDAGYGPDRSFDRNRTSVILGVTGALELVIPLGARLGHPLWRSALKDAGIADDIAEDVMARIADSYVSWQENSFPGLLGNVTAGRISKHFDLGGTNCVVDAACASSFSALHLAGLELASGKADMVVTGGIDTFNSIFMYMCFSKTPALSPSGDIRPFDAAGDGTILGEGLGIIVVKRLADAERDGDRIYAVIRGIGTSSDGKGEAIYAPSSAGQKKALLDAYQQAGVSPASIGMIEAHGTGTKVGDAVEVTALRDVYGEAEAPWCSLGSVKAQIGHTKAAAGAAGLIKAALSLYNKVIPPAVKIREPLAEVTSGRTPFYLPNEKRPWLPREGSPRRAGVSAFGFGGSNFHVVLEEYRPNKESAEWDGDVQIIPFSGADADTLETALGKVTADAPWNELRGFAAASRDVFSEKALCRLVLVVERGRTDVSRLLANVRKMLREHPVEAWNTPDGAYFACGKKPGKLAMLFPGQGSQYVGMLRDMACRFPQMLDTLALADDGFLSPEGKRLSDVIYPVSPVAGETGGIQEKSLRQTEAAQPAIGAVSLGLYKLMRAFGVTPDALAGHSYGELTALCAAGRFDETTLHQLSRLRGRLMGEGRGERGGMLAVAAPLATVEQAVAEERLNLVVANRNAPAQAVLSGGIAELERAEASFASRGIACKRLLVGAAFHSPIVADAAGPFLAALDKIELKGGYLPVYANTTAAPYPSDPTSAKAILAYQLAKPVEFVAEIEAMYAAGVRTFVETGPGARLTGLVRAILTDRPHTAVAVDGSAGKRPGVADLARALALLAAEGYGMLLSQWDEGYSAPRPQGKRPSLTVPICGANFVKPRPARAPLAQKQPAVEVKAQEMTGKSNTMETTTPAPASSSRTLCPSREELAGSHRLVRESMAVLQKMQEETARLHLRFLEGQEQAARTLQTVLERQRTMMNQAEGTGSLLPVESHHSPSNDGPLPAAGRQSTVAAVNPAAGPGPSSIMVAPAAVNPVAETLLAVISEKTGYPVEMLEMDMGMDSDLGIDSIKRVEILSALRERLPDAPAIGPEHLGTLRTLGDIAAYLGKGQEHANQEQATKDEERGITKTTSTSLTKSNDEIAIILLAVVSEKTGYPVEMLEMDMGMDSDLGIDSIKRVEILSALKEKLPDAPDIGPEHLGTLRTLGEIAAHLGKNQERETRSEERDIARTSSVTLSSSDDDISAILLAVVSEKTGYPVEMLEMDMGMDSDLGIDSIKRVEILSALKERLPDAPVIGPEHLGTLRTLAEIAAHLGNTQGRGTRDEEQDVKSSSEVSHPESRLAPNDHPAIARSMVVPARLDGTAVPLSLADDGVFWVTDDGSPFIADLCTVIQGRGLNVKRICIVEANEILLPEKLSGLVIAAPLGGTDDRFLTNAFILLKNAAPALCRAAAAGGAFCAALSHMDGMFGCAHAVRLVDPLSGGLAGLIKTAAREWPEIAFKAIDLGGYSDPSAMARAVAGELFRTGPVEVGLNPDERTTLELAHLPAAPPLSSSPVEEGELVIITGGGRGVTAAAALALTSAFRPLLLLLGRSPEPADEPAWLALLDEEAQIKRAIIEHAGGKLHPRDIEERYRAIIAGREIRATLQRIAAAGGTAIYRSVDIRESSRVAAILADIRREHGPVRGIVHGAGVLADRLIADKSPEQFAQVYSTKIDGLRSLLGAAADDDLRFIALFSSTTARFGRIGQVDYAVANEVLNKLARAEAWRRPDCRVVSINWGPWDGGMVTPALKKVFANEGIGLIDMAEGGEFLAREIAATGAPVEIVALAGATGREAAVPSTARPVSLGEAFALTLTVDDYPFLRSHVLGGKAVLPMAVIAEWLAHGALHGNPGFRLHGFNDLRICKGVVLGQEHSCTLRIMAGRAEKRDTFYLVPVELVGSGPDGRPILHARAEIVLATRIPEGIRSIGEIPATPYQPGNDGIYGSARLFHGPELHGIEQVIGCSAKGIAALVKGAPAPACWIRHPLRSIWITDPLVLDSAFQLMILWSLERFGAASLPCYAGRYRQFVETFPREGAQVVIRVTTEHERKATADMEFLDRHSGKLMARLEDYECIIDPSLKQAFQRNRLEQPGSEQLGAA